MQSNLLYYNKIVKEVSKNLNLDYNKVDKIYRAYCKLIVEKLSSLPLKEDITEEEFNKLQTNINLPSLGKLYTNWQTILNLKQKNIYVQKAKKNKTTRN